MMQRKFEHYGKDICNDWKISPGLPSNLVMHLTRKFKVSTGYFVLKYQKKKTYEMLCELLTVIPVMIKGTSI